MAKWYEDNNDNYDDNNYRHSVSHLRANGFNVDAYGFYSAPKDKPWMQGGYVDEDGHIHQDM